MGSKIENAIRATLARQEIVLDEGQTRALKALSELASHVVSEDKKSVWAQFLPFGSKNKDETQGVYLFGDVGRGKTMLMDAFYEGLPKDYPKMRVHFHAFMKDVHEFLHNARQSETSKGGVDQAVPEYIKKISSEVKLICFDEFHITDVADAMILSRLFTALFDQGVYVVMTSNWIPQNLYEGGLQRDRIIPFIKLIEQTMQVVELDGDVDYRKQIMKGRDVYFSPLNSATQRKIADVKNQLVGDKQKTTTTLNVKGREIVLEETYGAVAVVSFSDMCMRALGAQDYLALAEEFSVVIVTGILKLSPEQRNEAKRFMTFIDILYDAKTLVVMSAQTPADQIYAGHDHAFEFDRTVSRLIEMQSQTYLEGLK